MTVLLRGSRIPTALFKRYPIVARAWPSVAFRPSARAKVYCIQQTAHLCPWYSHAHIWSLVGPIIPNHLKMLKPQIVGALLVASGLLNSYMKFHQKRLSCKAKTICPYLGICTKFDRFWPINWSNGNIFE